MTGFKDFVQEASQAKDENRQQVKEAQAEFLALVAEEKAKIAAENQPNLREIARLEAESQMDYYGVGKSQPNLFHRVNYQSNSDRTFQVSTTTIIPRLGASENGNGNGNKGFGK
jgi:UDP-N-acetylmuramate-alanine ligase